MSDERFAVQIGSFQFSCEAIARMQEERGLDSDQLLRQLVLDVQPRARVPVSDFRVGAAGMNAAGEVFLGVNVEFSGASFAQTIHAEQFLVSLSRTRSSSPLVKIAVSAPPCGHCRQFVTEFDPQGKLELLIGKEVKTTMEKLLPQAFSPLDLKVTEPFYSRPLTLSESTTLQEAAKLAALQSYVPYSKCRAGTAVKSVKGEVFAGSALENAAYNPALPPLQAALVSAYAGGCPPEDVVEVVLCQDTGAQIDYEPQIRDLTKALSGRDVAFSAIEL